MGPWQGKVEVVGREDLTPDYFKLTFVSPAIAAAAEPGRFVNLAVDEPETCLRRPISIHAVEGDQVTLLVGVTGRGTAALQRRSEGDRLDVLGPLGGRGLSVRAGAERVVLVGGGVGIPPLRFLCQRLQQRAAGLRPVTFIGARTFSRLLCVGELEDLGAEVRTSTDDGSHGYHGTSVAALAAYLAEHGADQLLTCGPTPMMHGVAELAEQHGIDCQVCLEARMACALGACLSCVVETRTDGWQRYQRVCTEGPVFDSKEIVWERFSPLCAL